MKVASAARCQVPGTYRYEPPISRNDSGIASCLRCCCESSSGMQPPAAWVKCTCLAFRTGVSVLTLVSPPSTPSTTSSVPGFSAVGDLNDGPPGRARPMRASARNRPRTQYVPTPSLLCRHNYRRSHLSRPTPTPTSLPRLQPRASFDAPLYRVEPLSIFNSSATSARVTAAFVGRRDM